MRFFRAVIKAQVANAQQDGDEVFKFNENTVKTFFNRKIAKRRTELKLDQSGIEPKHGTYYHCLDALIAQWDLVNN